MEDWLCRQRLFVGEEACRKLRDASVAIVGLGGVGGACAESLCRAGVGRLILVDHDVVDWSNLNRQIIATTETIGMPKTAACEKRLHSIHPDCCIVPLKICYTAETAEQLFELHPDYIADCIDMVTAKLHLAESCTERRIPLLMALGTGNRMDPSAFRIGTVEDTAAAGGCGLARVMRRELKKRGITGVPAVYSLEAPAKAVVSGDGRYAPGSISFCPPAAGFLMASRIVRDLIGGSSKG